MEYQKTQNVTDKSSDQTFKFQTKMWVEINYDASGTYSSNSQIKFKTTMTMSDLCEYAEVYCVSTGNWGWCPSSGWQEK